MNISTEASDIFFFTPRLHIRLGNENIPVSKRNLLRYCKNESTKKEIEQYLAVNCFSFYKSIMTDEIYYRDYLLYVYLNKEKLKNFPKSLEALTSCESSKKNYSNHQEKLNLSINNLIANIERISSKSKNQNIDNDSMKFLFNSLYPEIPYNLNASNPKINEQVQMISEKIQLLSRLSRGNGSLDDKKELGTYIDKINVDSQMIKSILSERDINSIRELKSLSLEERGRRIDELNHNDGYTTTVVAVAAAAGIVYGVAWSIQKTKSDYCDIKSNNIS